MSADTILPNSDAANDVYDLLVSIGGAEEASRESFVLYSGEKEDSVSEWRFQGHFGFGGKFRTRWGNGKNKHDWYVDLYPEDDTVERSGLVKILNEKLEILRKRHML